MEIKENDVVMTGIVPINTKEREFKLLMSIYQKAMEQLVNELNQKKEELKDTCNCDIINNITYRIKSPKSIVNKMKKKHYELNYRNLIHNINDIAGIRIVCPLKSNIYQIINVIEQMPNVKILKRKDYISKPKKSGYSGYHIIVKTPIKIEEETIYIKVEIQLRTMAMDFWATNEHKMRYKANKKISKRDSKKLTIYARILNLIDNKIMKIYNKTDLREI